MTVPALFVAHGSPALAVENNAYTRFLEELGSRLPRPRGIVVFSAHWDSPDQCVDVDEQHSTLYDFYGFPEEMYTIEYPAPGDPEIHNEVLNLFKLHNLHARPVQNRGLDHGVWVFLHHMYPNADIPIIPLSIDSRRSPKEQYIIGCMLSSLREKGVMIVGSGGLVHNLRRLCKNEEPESWATDFDDWIGEQLQTWNLKQLFDYRKKAPFAEEAVPSYAKEHFAPLFYAMGATDNDRRAEKLFQTYDHGCLSLNCWLFGTTTI